MPLRLPCCRQRLPTVVPLALTGREEFDVLLSPATQRGPVAAYSKTASVRDGSRRCGLRWSQGATSRGTTAGAPLAVAIVNETLARQFWNGKALGERLRFGDRTLEVVGVARDSKYRTLGETTRPLVDLPLRQEFLHFVTLHVRTADPRATVATMTSELERLIPGADACGSKRWPRRLPWR